MSTDQPTSNVRKMQAHPRFVDAYSMHGRFFVRFKTPGERLRSRVIGGQSYEEAAGLALITMRVT